VFYVVLGWLLTIQEFPLTPHPWEIADDDNGIKVYKRVVPGAPYKEVKGVMDLAATPKRVFELLYHIEDHKTYMPFLDEIAIVGDANVNPRLEYRLTDVPLLSARDQIVAMEYNDLGNDHYELKWRCLKDGYPEKADVIRINDCYGYWQLLPIEKNQTHIEYMLYCLPGGSLPTWIVNRMSIQVPIDVLKALQNRLLSP